MYLATLTLYNIAIHGCRILLLEAKRRVRPHGDLAGVTGQTCTCGPMHSAWGTASPEICATRADNSEGAGGRGVGASSRAAHLTNVFVFFMWSHCSFVRRGGPALAHISPEASCASESSRTRPNRPVGELCDAVRGLGSGASTPQRWRPEAALAGTGQLQGSAAGRLVAASGRAEESARLEARRRPPSSRDRARDMAARAGKNVRSITTKGVSAQQVICKKQ